MNATSWVHSYVWIIWYRLQQTKTISSNRYTIQIKVVTEYGGRISGKGISDIMAEKTIAQWGKADVRINSSVREKSPFRYPGCCDIKYEYDRRDLVTELVSIKPYVEY